MVGQWKRQRLHRGAAGGYALSRAADEITVAQIIQALEGPIALTACVDGSSDQCDVESLCPMRGNWDKVNKAIYKALSELTLEDMSTSALMFEEAEHVTPCGVSSAH